MLRLQWDDLQEPLPKRSCVLGHVKAGKGHSVKAADPFFGLWTLRFCNILQLPYFQSLEKVH